MIQLNDSNFEEEVLQSDVPVMVDFYSNHCIPCRSMSIIMENLSEKVDNMKFAKIEISDSLDTFTEYCISSVPTFIIFVNGEKMEEMIGTYSEEELLGVIYNYV